MPMLSKQLWTASSTGFSPSMIKSVLGWTRHPSAVITRGTYDSLSKNEQVNRLLAAYHGCHACPSPEIRMRHKPTSYNAPIQAPVVCRHQRRKLKYIAKKARSASASLVYTTTCAPLING